MTTSPLYRPLALAPLLALALLAAAGAARAHTAWFEPDPAQAGRWIVRFGGHAGKIEPYDAAKLKTVQALDAHGAALPVQRLVEADGVRVVVKGRPALLALYFDNGIYSKAPGGTSVERPMDRNPGATQGTRALKHGKRIVEWTAVVARPLGQPFEVLPLAAEPPRAGQPWAVKVLVDGRPAAGVGVGHDESGPDDVRTDAEGIARFVPRAGVNKLWAGQRTEIAGNPQYTQLSYEYLLVFEAR